MGEISKKEAYIAPSIKVRTDRRNTEAGLTQAQRDTLSWVERYISGQSNESLYAVDEDGRILVRNEAGTGDSVRIPDNINYSDAVVTHNHPSHWRDGFYNQGGIAGRVGTAFSEGDIIAMVDRNFKELRAVTPNYTYSIKRPANGWGVDSTDVKYVVRRLKQEYYNEDYDYVTSADSREEFDTRNARTTVAHADSIMKDLAKRFGWKYTRRKNG